MDSSSSPNNTTNGSSQEPSERRLCASGCGFFGTPENRGLCSQCYAAHIKQQMLKLLQSTPITNEDIPNSTPDHHDDQSSGNTNTELEADINNLVSALSSAAITEIDKTKSSNVSEINNPPVMKRRCVCCNKKVGLLGFVCRCGETFCGSHRYPEAHHCNIDYKTAGKIAIAEENPLIKADKISERL